MAFQFHVSIKNITPSVWRRLIVPGGYNFYQFHVAIQAAFGWENSHLFQFCKNGLIDKECIGLPDDSGEAGVHEAKKILLSSVFKKKNDSQVYIYDFGDHWQHAVILESLLDKEPEGIVCIDGENECPPEDVGGISGYEEMLECFEGGSETEKNEYRVWLGLKPAENWDPQYFSLRETNKRLAFISYNANFK